MYVLSHFVIQCKQDSPIILLYRQEAGASTRDLLDTCYIAMRIITTSKPGVIESCSRYVKAPLTPRWLQPPRVSFLVSAGRPEISAVPYTQLTACLKTFKQQHEAFILKSRLTVRSNRACSSTD